MKFSYEATDKRGAPVIGIYEADSKAEVSEYLERKKLIPVAIRQQGALSLLDRGRDLVFFEKITPLDRIGFVRNLSATVKAGLSIIEALDILAHDAEKRQMKKMLLQIKNNMQNGQPLWEALQEYRGHFPPFFIGMIKAAESAGKLESTLDELSRYLIRDYDLSKKVKSAFAYPTLLLIASAGVILVLLVFVLPGLERTFQRSQVVLPVYTRAILAVGNGIRNNIGLDILAAALIFGALTAARRSQKIKNFLAKLFFHLPLAGPVIKKIALVRFSRTLGSMLGSGALITDSLRMSADSVGNEYYRGAILKVAADVGRGLPFSRSLSDQDRVFPHFLASLAAVGEKTGSLENILKSFADFYDDEVDYSLRSLVTVLEPILLLSMGLVIGFLVLSILLPIYQFVGKFL